MRGQLAPVLIAGVMFAGSGCATAQPQPAPVTVVQVGPLQPAPTRPFADLVADEGLASVVEATIAEIGALQWHRGDIIYPYCLVRLTTQRQWKQPQPTEFAVRVFGGAEGDRKYVSAIQPDPAQLRPGTRVLLFVSTISEIDPGVKAATVEEFFFIDGDRLLRFDRTPADVTVAGAYAALERPA